MKIRLCAIIKLLLFIHVSVGQNELKPHIELLPSEPQVRQNLGESVYVSCDPKVRNTDLITNVEWRNSRGEIILSGEDEHVSTMAFGEPHQLGLMISSLSKQDVGNYTCTANYAGNQKLSKTIEILSQVSIDFQDTETRQTPVLGSDAKIRCVVTAEPSPTIDWNKDGVALAASDKRYIQQNDGILIKNIQESDEGLYRCRARVAILGELKFRYIQVEVHVKPKITGAPADTEGKEKESVAFQCIATGKPLPKYQWVNKDSEVLNNKDGFYVDEISGELRILHLRPDHAGTYRCTAENSAGAVTVEAKLRVLMQPKIERFLNITRGLDSTSELRCIVSGDPLPSVIFRKRVTTEPFRDGFSDDDRIQVVQEINDDGNRVGRIIFSKLARRDDGLYSCKGNSSGGVSEAWGHVTVEFPPTFEDQPLDEFWSWDQKPVNLSCLATSIPNATIQWFQRLDPIRASDSNLKIISHGPNGILEVTPLDGSYFDTYTCKATNTLGDANHEVTLKRVQKPGPISSTQIEKTTATTVSWNIRDPLDDGGLPIVGYTTQYRLRDDPWDDNTKNHYWTKGSEKNYLVDKLIPQERYVFRFAARNDAGDGEWSGDKNVVMEARSSPEDPLIYSLNYPEVKKIPYSDHYELQWQVPLSNGEPIDFFQVTYYTVKEDNEQQWKIQGSQQQKTVEYPGKSSVKLEGLSSDSYYKIELRAHNKIGYSIPSEGIIKTAFASITQPTTDEKSAHNVGLIIGIVLICLIIGLILLDCIFYFLMNVGITATLVKKLCAKPNDQKDKEAMIEEAVKENGGEKSESANATKETDGTETTPMITGESDKEAILKEEKEQQKHGEDSPTAEEIKKSESKNSITNDSPV